MGDTQGAPPPSDGRAGYLTPEEQARRQSQDNQMDRGMNMGSIRILQQRQQQDTAANAAATGGGFKMDVETMKSLLPQWESIRDKLGNLTRQGEQLLALSKPAEDEGSILQKKAADAHANAYQLSVQAQRDYAQAYAAGLRKAIDSTEQQNQAAVDAVRKNGVQR
jgi:hypothetical protein